MAQHGSLLLSLLFVISVSELAVICALGEAEMWSACLVEHSVASWGDMRVIREPYFNAAALGRAGLLHLGNVLLYGFGFGFFWRFFWVLFIANHLNSTFLGLTLSYL